MPTYTVTTISRPLDAGVIQRSPNLERYEAGTEVTITATALEGFRFKRFSETYSKSQSVKVIVNDGDITFTANFEKKRPPRPPRPKPQPAQGTRYGVRAAYNYTGSNVDAFFYGRRYSWSSSDYDVVGGRSDFGHGTELGLATSTYLSDFWTFRSGVNLIYRNPVVIGDGCRRYNNNCFSRTIGEVAVAIPAFLRVGGRSMITSTYFETGLQLDIAFSELDERNMFDIGYGWGHGFTIGRHIEIGQRFIINLRRFADASGQPSAYNRNRLMQYSAGITYMIGGK